MPETGHRCTRCGSPKSEAGSEPFCVGCLLEGALKVDAAASNDDPGFLTWTGLDVPEEVIGTLGDYQLIERIGRGGMGDVFRARQTGLDREVAVKLLSRGILADQEARERLKREARFAGKLRHPNVVAVYDVGEAEGLPFYVMELVVSDNGAPAPNLQSLVKERALPADRAARYAALVAWAVAAAHREGILHRDLKPSNVLVDAYDQPKVADFGLATRLSMSTARSTARAGLGTPGYAPPEQVAGDPGGAREPSDIYGIGGILYCLLTCHPPFSGATEIAISRQVMESDPKPPRELNQDVPADLETICLKCLEKKPADRYASAEALAEDLERFLRREPIAARPAGSVERWAKWCRRKPQVAAWALASVVLFFVGFAVSVVLGLRAEMRRQDAERAYGLLASSRAEEHAANGETSLSLAYLADILRRNPRNAVAAQRAASSLAFGRIPKLQELPSSPGGYVTALGSDIQAKILGFADVSGGFELWSLPDRRILRRIHHPVRMESLDVDPPGKRVLTVGSDGRMRVWSVADGRLLWEASREGQATMAAEWIDDGRLGLSLLGDGTVGLWDGETFGKLSAFEEPGERFVTVALLPGRGQIRTVAQSGRVRNWSLESREPVDEGFEVGDWSFLNLSRDGGWLVAGQGAQVVFFDLDRRGFRGRIVTCRDAIRALEVTRDGNLAVVSLADGTIHFVARDDGSEPREAPSIRGAAIVHVSGAGNLVAIADFSGRVRFCETPGRRPPAMPLGEGRTAVLVRGSSRNDRVMVVEDSGEVVLCSPFADTNRWIRTGVVSTTAAAMGPRGDLMVLPDSRGVAHVHCREAGWNRVASLGHPKRVQKVVISADERTILTATGTNAWVWKLSASGRTNGGPRVLAHAQPVISCDIDPARGRIVTLSRDGVARIWPKSDAQPPMSLDLGVGSLSGGVVVADVRFLPDGRDLLTIGGGRVHLWDAVGGMRRKGDLQGNRAQEILAYALSSDGRRLALSFANRDVRILDARNSELGAVVFRNEGPAEMLRFSGDGAQLLAGSPGDGVRLWDVASGLPVTVAIRPAGRVVDGVVASDGRYLLLAGASGVWLHSTTRLSVPVPASFPELLERLAGRSLRDSGASNGTEPYEASPPSGRGGRLPSDWDRFLKWFESSEAGARVWSEAPF